MILKMQANFQDCSSHDFKFKKARSKNIHVIYNEFTIKRNKCFLNNFVIRDEKLFRSCEF